MAHVAPIVLHAIGAIAALLAAASAVVFAMTRMRPEKDYTELVRRTRSWWFLVALFAATLLANDKVAVVFMGFLSFLALKEFFTIIPYRRVDRRILFWAYLSIPIQFYWIATGWYTMFIIFIPVYVFFLVAGRMVLTGETEGFLKTTATVQWVLMITVFSIGHAAYLFTLPPLPVSGAGGRGLLLYMVLVVQLNDVAQYVWGKTLGRRKILPKVSPGKTWGGFLGGLGTSICLSLLIAPLLTPMNFGWSLLVGACLASLGFLGDVTISAIKRDLGVKDTGAIIPGHGGIMDRIDSLTFTAPLFFHAMWYLYY